MLLWNYRTGLYDISVYKSEIFIETNIIESFQ